MAEETAEETGEIEAGNAETVAGNSCSSFAALHRGVMPVTLTGEGET